MKNFNDWIKVNENDKVEDTEKLRKIIDDLEKWAHERGYKIYVQDEGVEIPHLNIYFMVQDIFGTWTLSYEQGKKKSGVSSMGSREYTSSGGRKWYIEFPGARNRYDHRGKKQAGNAKTFKALVDEFAAKKVEFETISKFIESALKVELPEEPTISRWTTEVLKSLSVDIRFGSGEEIVMKRAVASPDYRFEGRISTGFDPTKGEFLFYTTMGLEKIIVEKHGQNYYDLVISILDLLKNEPLEKVLKETEGGDWEALKHKYRGRIHSTKFGL